MRIPKIISKGEHVYIIEKEYPNFIRYEQIKMGKRGQAMIEVAVCKMRNGKIKKAVKLEMDMRNCLEIPLKNNMARHNRARLKENLRKCVEEREEEK